MPTLATKALGQVNLEPGEIIHFPEGLIGFQEYREFALLRDREESPFLWLQSVEESTLAFVVVRPEVFAGDRYSPRISSSDLEKVQVKQLSECEILSIVTIPENQPEKMTANLQGPVLINAEKRVGRQVISNDEKHSVRVPILEMMEA